MLVHITNWKVSVCVSVSERVRGWYGVDVVSDPVVIIVVVLWWLWWWWRCSGDGVVPIKALNQTDPDNDQG